MWTEKNRSRYNRDHLRYPSDVTDDEWELIAPLISVGEARRRQAARGYASGDERRDVCAEHRMPVALYPQGLAAAQHGEPLFFATGV